VPPLWIVRFCFRVSGGGGAKCLAAAGVIDQPPDIGRDSQGAITNASIAPSSISIQRLRRMSFLNIEAAQQSSVAPPTGTHYSTIIAQPVRAAVLSTMHGVQARGCSAIRSQPGIANVRPIAERMRSAVCRAGKATPLIRLMSEVSAACPTGRARHRQAVALARDGGRQRHAAGHGKKGNQAGSVPPVFASTALPLRVLPRGPARRKIASGVPRRDAR